MENSQRYNIPTEEEVEAEAQSGSTFISRFFKIARCEQTHFWTMTIIFFIIGYVYSLSREMKDALVIERLDPASIPYLKMLIVLPLNIVVVFLVQKFLSVSSIYKVISITSLIFSIYFVCYGIVIQTFRDALELNPYFSRDWFSDGKMEYIGLEWTSALILTINSWTTSLFYVTAELWSTLMVQFLFFCYANEICTLKQSLRYTPLFLVFSNISLILSGVSMKSIKFILDNSSYGFVNFFKKCIFLGMGLGSFIIFCMINYFEKHVRHKQLFIPTNPQNVQRRTGSKVGFMDGLEVISASKLVVAMSFIVIAYSISVNMVESSFKSCMNQYALYRGVNVSSHVMSTQSDIQLAVGGFAILLLLSPFTSLIKKRGFKYVAYACPIFSIFGIVSVFGFAFYNVKTKAMLMGNPYFYERMLWTEQLLGVIAITGFKLLKYAAFDISKEAISMKINPLYRARFKGIYDGICGKLGKAMGSGLTNIQNVFYNTTDVREASFSSLGMMTSLSVMWIVCINYLSSKYDKSIDNNTDIDIDVFEGKSLD
ncbi:ATP:ADP Antiporter (AAA) Family [Tubulinosema ratisbonensis]|uniref:ADP,ATP carrier protein n=1 Tax=Tubulinosema ratisbonensis TaxID=291195 RepID=A0A437ALE7_9MICR|nr:ATP:ADP Antiporter (AAA) Family [Tubulinosema ratisbonensis]